MIGTWGVDIEESNNFILLYIIIFAMTYAVTNVSYKNIGNLHVCLTQPIVKSLIGENNFTFRLSLWFMNWLLQQFSFVSWKTRREMMDLKKNHISWAKNYENLRTKACIAIFRAVTKSILNISSHSWYYKINIFQFIDIYGPVLLVGTSYIKR